MQYFLFEVCLFQKADQLTRIVFCNIFGKPPFIMLIRWLLFHELLQGAIRAMVADLEEF